MTKPLTVLGIETSCDETAAAVVRGLPPGTYTLEVWHEKLGTLTQEVPLAPREVKEVAFAYQAG